MTASGEAAGQPPTAEPNSDQEAPQSGGPEAEATEQVQLPPAYAEQPPYDSPPAYGGPPQGFDAPRGYGPPPAFGPQPGYGPPPAYGAPPQPYGPPPGFAAPPPQPYGAPGYGPPPPYPPQPGYGPPAGPPAYPGGYGPYGPPKQHTNGLAIASLASSGVGLFLSVVLFFFGGFIGSIPALVGIVLGIVALSQIKSRREGGRSFAIAGIAVGAAALVFAIGVYVVFYAIYLSAS
ncbi:MULTISPECIES: DUF4190 domain-containing protein [unclassified Mycobacterium]|uniref:DUF4190 domain-containing protein n=1 Tax=unclassified Mycobacterium TaxID=2642494 RepID=UPI0029C85733|nr:MULTISPECIES: DUF4190 domain-containing protein [unclassified Mycobacterium]